MGTLTKPNTFSANTTISSSQVNDNFDTLYNGVNGNLDANNLATGAVTTAKIADSNVTTAKIADDNVTAAKIADAAVFPANLTAGLSGSSWAWVSWTPTLTNISGGAITFAKYMQIGKTVHFKFKYTFGGAGVAGAVSLTLPVTAISDYAAADTIPGTVSSYDLSATTGYLGVIRVASTTTINIRTIHTDGARANYEELSSSNPFTWATGDVLMVSGTYEAA